MLAFGTVQWEVFKNCIFSYSYPCFRAADWTQYPFLYHYFPHMLLALLRMLGHFSLIFPCRFKGMPVKEADGKLKRSNDMNAGNLLTESRFVK